MTKPITLKGMTWSHPRGYDPDGRLLRAGI
jgi:hypothetical protein